MRWSRDIYMAKDSESELQHNDEAGLRRHVYTSSNQRCQTVAINSRALAPVLHNLNSTKELQLRNMSL